MKQILCALLVAAFPSRAVVWPDRIVRGANISADATEEDVLHYPCESVSIPG